MAYKKVILNVDDETYSRYMQLYGRTVGVSAAIRALMQKHLKALDAKKEAAQLKEDHKNE